MGIECVLVRACRAINNLEVTPLLDGTASTMYSFQYGYCQYEHSDARPCTGTKYISPARCD